MLNRLRDEVCHVYNEVVHGEHRAAWWVLMAAELVGVVLVANVL